MAKELMEIGGFITEGAEIVNHDASLSGNGTVDSPLGVVPGYNETVLFSASQGTSSCTLSEDLTNFTRLRFKLGNVAGTEGWQYQEIPAITSNVIHLSYNCGGGGNEYYVGLYGNMSSTTAINLTQCVAVKAPFSNTTATTTTGNNNYYQKAIFEVVGINRIANN